MFQLTDIKQAHLKVKSGADFPNYVQDLINLGVEKYDTYVNDGHSLFLGVNNYQVQTDAKYSSLHIANESDSKTFQHYLKIHQQGHTDYPTFCRHCAETGVEKWTVDMNLMTCTYYDRSSTKMLEENIPTP